MVNVILDKKIVSKTGNGVADKIYFEATLQPDLGLPLHELKDHIAEAQFELGYHPAGYGGPANMVVDGNVVTWHCYASCD